MEIREVRPDEYERAGRLVVASYRALPGDHMSGGYADELAAVARRATEAVVLVAVDEDVVGCATFVPDASSPWAELLADDESGLRMLAVDPTAQGRGIGAALLQACVVRARALERHGLFFTRRRGCTLPTTSTAAQGSCGFRVVTGPQFPTCPCWPSVWT